jgi:3-methylcrotonyl-CoA carboxylase beta subunit
MHEFKREYGRTLVCGTSTIHGHAVGVIANNGVLFSEAALKGAHFVQLCEAARTPLLFLQNVAGFMVGGDAERGGIAKHGAKLVNAVATSSTIAKFTVVIGGSYGAGNYGMCGRAYSPDLLFMWPNSRIGVMGGAQAADVLVRIRSSARARRRAKEEGRPGLTAAEQQAEAGADDAFRREMEAKYDREARPEFSTSRVWDDGVIDPAQTRAILGFALALAHSKREREQHGAAPVRQYGVFRM